MLDKDCETIVVDDRSLWECFILLKYRGLIMKCATITTARIAIHDKNTMNSDIPRNKGTRAFQYFCLQVRRDVVLRIKQADTKSHSFRRFSLISFSAPSFPLYAPEPFSFLASSPFFFFFFYFFFYFSPPFAVRGKSPIRVGNIFQNGKN